MMITTNEIKEKYLGLSSDLDFKTLGPNDCIKIYQDLQKRYAPDAIDLVYRLLNTGFFTAPASSSYHGAFDCGLFAHSIMVLGWLAYYTDSLKLSWSRPCNMFMSAMYHDLCKVDLYDFDYDKNKFIKKSDLFGGHGLKSIVYLQNLIREYRVLCKDSMLEPDEEVLMCIRWHMGAYDEESNWGNLSEAIKKYPNILYMHLADMSASKFSNI